MKSKTSCFKTAVKKDLTRFAPAWGGYILCLILGLLMMLDGQSDLGPGHYFPELIQLTGIVNLFYGLLVSQLLFGDLFSSRMCYGLHTLPLRRESWFAVHGLSGLLFSLIPTALMTAAAVPLTFGHTLQDGWQLPLYYLLGTNLQYLFFFGVGVLSMLLSGNRFGAVILYGIVNFAAILVYYVADTVFVPMLFGIVSEEAPYIRFSPVVQMVEYSFISVESFKVPTGSGYFRRGTFTLTGNWWYLWTCAGVGAAALAGALALYRKRDLERAGDLLAVKGLEPVFQVVFSVVCATVFHFVALGLFGYEENFTLLFVGLGAGWFFGRMLLTRTTRVFGGKSWLGLGLTALGVVLAIVGTHFDILGLETRIPEKHRIESVTLNQFRYSDRERNVILTEEKDIENILFLHEAALEDRLGSERLWYDGAPVETLPEGVDWTQVQRSTPVLLTYRLKNGAVMTRYYYVWSHQPEGQLLKGYYSSLRAILGRDSLHWSQVKHFSIGGWEIPAQFRTREHIEALLEAIRLDCEAGTMAQAESLHPLEPVLEYEYDGETQKLYAFWINLGMEEGQVYLDVFSDAEHTLQWIRSRGIDQYFTEKELKG